MNKKLLASAIAATVTLSMGTAFAADPINVSSTFKYEFRNNDDAATGSKSSADRMQVGVNFDGKIDANTAFFGRVAGQVSSFGKTPASTDFKMDQFGVKANLDGWNVSLGRQGAQLGQGGAFYAGNDIAPVSYFDGFVVTNKLGELNFKAIGGKTTAAPTTSRQKWYGVELNGDVNKDINVGFAFAGNNNVDVSGNVTPGAHYWSGFTTIKTGENLAWTGEYVKSNASTANRAYDLSGTYSFDKSNSFTVAYNNVQTNSTDIDNSSIGGEYYPNGDAFTAGYKGLTYVYHHDVNKNLGLNVILLDLKPMAGGETNKEFAANLKWKF